MLLPGSSLKERKWSTFYWSLNHWAGLLYVIGWILKYCCWAINGIRPKESSDLLVHYQPSRPLRSSGAGLLSIPRIRTKQGEAAFSFHVPHLWNKLLTWGLLKLSVHLNQDLKHCLSHPLNKKNMHLLNQSFVFQFNVIRLRFYLYVYIFAL